MKIILTEEELNVIYQEETYLEITQDHEDEHRWYWGELMIFPKNDKKYATYIMIPKSEMQDGQEMFDSEQDAWEVEKTTVTITKEKWIPKK